MKQRAIVKRAGWAGAAALVALVAGSSVIALAADTAVDIIGVGGGYSPASVTVDPGNTVTWTNRDQTAAHNAVCSVAGDGCPVDMAPDGGKLEASGKSQSFTFQYSGTYNYHCAAHPSMKGTVIVTGNIHPPASSTSSGSTPAANPGGGGTTTSTGGTGAGTGQGGSAAGGSRPPAGPAGSGSAANGASTDTASTSQAVKDSLVGVNLPRPNIIIKNQGGGKTPQWVVLATGAAMAVCALLFAVAWFGPPIRLPRRSG